MSASDAAKAWVEAVDGLGGDSSVAVATAESLDARYAEQHRRYHTGTHVRAVLRDAAALADELQLPSWERAVLSLAACAHDVVYDAQPGADEEASALWASDHLGRAGVPQDAISRVAELVLLTRDHSAPEGDTTAAVLLDADLAILGTPEDVYDGYSAAVRQEFVAVPDDLWRLGRVHVLEGLADRPQLYLTAAGRARWEAPARANLARELAQLLVPADGVEPPTSRS